VSLGGLATSAENQIGWVAWAWAHGGNTRGYYYDLEKNSE